MEEFKKNKVLLFVVALTLINLLVFGLGKIVIEKISDRVIEKLQKEYSPSPYGPGFDPDKVSPSVLDLKHGRFQDELAYYQGAVEKTVWQHDWESERGFTP